jgi:AraC family transcriptional regulator
MKDATRRHYEELVTDAVEQLRAGLDGPFDLAQLGRRAHLSPLHFHRIFRGLLGETPGELHRRLRLERAAWALARSQRPVTRIALDAGYDTHESFTRAFTIAFGRAPTVFRSHAKDNPTSWGVATASALAVANGIHFAGNGGPAAIRFSAEQVAATVAVQRRPAKRVLAVAHRGPYNTISAAFVKLDSLARKLALRGGDCTELVALFYDDPEVTPAAEQRADAGLVVPAHVAAPEGLHVVTIPAGTYACTVHRGPYETLGDAWSRLLGGWLVQSGHRVGALPMYERYLNTPGGSAPTELLTELYVGLADREEPPPRLHADAS